MAEWFLAGSEPSANSGTWYLDGNILLPNDYSAWCQSSHNHLNATTKSLQMPAESDHIVIRSPRNGSRFVIDSAIPSEAQRLPFHAEHTDPKSLEWHLNGVLLDTSDVPITWPLQAGRWQLTVEDPHTDRKGSSEFVVEAE